MKCRSCRRELEFEFVDLGSAPPSNAFLTESQLQESEVGYPLKLFVCEGCWLVQLGESLPAEQIFNPDYVYFSSFSRSALAHAEAYVAMISEGLALDQNSRVIEVASNDGYLLQYFMARGIPCLGIEPTQGTARAARERGIRVIGEFFGTALAERLREQGDTADLLLGNNVLAHVPDLNDFVAGLKAVLEPQGTITMEFPHLMRLVESNQFDTIYHEHFCYFSLIAVEPLFRRQGLLLFDVDELPTHGGSLRIYAAHDEAGRPETSRLETQREVELRCGMNAAPYYRLFQEKVDRVRDDFLGFLREQREMGRSVVAYGAAAKGNTLLNYCGVDSDQLPFVVDISPHKQGKFLPGSHIPVVAETQLREAKPDFVVILPWNIQDEVREQLCYIRDWGGRFVVAVPRLNIL